MIYELDERAVRWRARWGATLGAAATLAPALLVVVLLSKLGVAPNGLALGVAMVLGAMAVVRAVVGYAQLARHLRALSVTIAADALEARTARGTMRVRKDEIERVREFAGALGGLRIDARAAGEPMRFDLPRGGERFGELKTALEAWGPIERATRRRRGARVAFGAGLVLAIFFVPFVLDDLVGRSRFAATALVAGVWLGAWMLRRR